MCDVQTNKLGLVMAGGAALGGMWLTHSLGKIGEEFLEGSKLTPWVRPGLATALGVGALLIGDRLDSKTYKDNAWIAPAIAGVFIGTLAYGLPRGFSAMGFPAVASATGQLAGPPAAQAEIQDPRQMLALAWALADGDQRREMLEALREEESGALPMPEDDYEMRGDPVYRHEKAAELDELLHGDDDPGDYYDYYAA